MVTGNEAHLRLLLFGLGLIDLNRCRRLCLLLSSGRQHWRLDGKVI